MIRRFDILAECTARALLMLLAATCGLLSVVLPGEAQTALKVSEPCQPVVTTPKTAYEVKLATLTAQLAQKKLEYERMGSDNAELKRRAIEEINTLKGDIVDVSFDLDCFRTEWTSEPPLRGDGQWLEITTFYATNRAPVGASEPGIYYGSGVASGLSFGRVAVTIPTQHTLGELELPAGWKFWSSADPNKHFTIKAVAPLAAEKALEELRAVLGKAQSNSILLFVHGYRVTFIEAALRTAQLANDLRFPGVAMFYSWPSVGTVKSYFHDEEAVELSVRSLSALLATLTAQPAAEIYILAHSMGSRATTKALADLVQSGKSTDKFRELLLAAPDINADLFRTEIAPRLLGVAQARRTIYASSGDLALRASAGAHDFHRVGETAGGVQVFTGFDTIDVSTMAPMRRAWGHSYVFDNIKILADIEDSVVWQRSFSERSLDRKGVAPNQYWSIR